MMANPGRPRVAIIGGGLGGLVCAARLAHAGLPVDLYEQQPMLGGKVARIEHSGCSFDVGPSLVTMPFVLDEFFRSVGTAIDHHLSLVPIAPACRYRWLDGTRFDIPNPVNAFEATAPEAYRDAFRMFGHDDASAVVKYLESGRSAYEGTKNIFLFNDFGAVGSWLPKTSLQTLFAMRHLNFFSTLHGHHEHIFNDPKLVQLFDRFATYNGSNPFEAPGTLKIIPWVEFGFGSWYPLGGMYTIAQAFEATTRACGTRLHTSNRIRSIKTENGTATGIVDIDGSYIPYDVIVSNMDVRTTQSMLGETPRSSTHRSMAGFVITACVRSDSAIAHHNVLFSSNYREEFNTIFNRRIPAEDMTIYISNSSVTDPSQARDGYANIFILVNAPALSADSSHDTWTDERSHRYAEVIFQRIRQYGLEIQPVSYSTYTPTEMATAWNTADGSIYGDASNSIFSAFLRQRPRSSKYSNLWYVGGSIHPGGGIPLVTLSGMITSNSILSHYNMPTL